MPSRHPRNEPHIVKRYSLTRLYDTTTQTYVDAAQLRALVHAGKAFTVLDSKTGEDVTMAFLRVGPPTS